MCVLVTIVLYCSLLLIVLYTRNSTTGSANVGDGGIVFSGCLATSERAHPPLYLLNE